MPSPIRVDRFQSAPNDGWTRLNKTAPRLPAILKCGTDPILQNRFVYDNHALRLTGENVSEMSLGKMMENMSIVASRHGKVATPVLKGLTKYASKAVNRKGFVHQGWDWMGPIVHGRRFEIDLLADVSDLKTGSDVLFEIVRNGRVAKVMSDVDAFLGTAAWSIKRQGKTVDSWAGSQDEQWLSAYMEKVKSGGPITGKKLLPPSDTLVFVTGKGGASTAVKEKLERIGARHDLAVIFKEDIPLLPPPPIN